MSSTLFHYRPCTRPVSKLHGPPRSVHDLNSLSTFFFWNFQRIRKDWWVQSPRKLSYSCLKLRFFFLKLPFSGLLPAILLCPHVLMISPAPSKHSPAAVHTAAQSPGVLILTGGLYLYLMLLDHCSTHESCAPNLPAIRSSGLKSFLFLRKHLLSYILGVFILQWVPMQAQTGC